MPARSRTSLDFKYNNNRTHNIVNGHQYNHHNNTTFAFGSHQRDTGQHHSQAKFSGLQWNGALGYRQTYNMMPIYGPDSDPTDQLSSLPYNWVPPTSTPQDTPFGGPDLGPLRGTGGRSEAQRPLSDAKHQALRGDSKSDRKADAQKEPLDEAKASIIEIFKAQVKARAKAPSVEEESRDDHKKAPPKDESMPVGGEQKGGGEMSSKEVKSGKTNDSSSQVAASRRSSEKNDEAAEKVDKEEEEKSTQIGGDSKVRRAGRLQTSNIPRLVSLHRSKFSTSKIETGSKFSELEQKKQTPSNTTKAKEALEKSVEKENEKENEKNQNSCRPNLKVDIRFVSQYKQLRGKSLADEVAELDK